MTNNKRWKVVEKKNKHAQEVLGVAGLGLRAEGLLERKSKSEHGLSNQEDGTKSHSIRAIKGPLSSWRDCPTHAACPSTRHEYFCHGTRLESEVGRGRARVWLPEHGCCGQIGL